MVGPLAFAVEGWPSESQRLASHGSGGQLQPRGRFRPMVVWTLWLAFGRTPSIKGFGALARDWSWEWEVGRIIRRRGRWLAGVTAAVMLAFPVLSVIGPPTSTVTGSNWAGYFFPAGAYRSIGGQWQMPRITSAHRPVGALSIWIGLQNTAALVQTGTAEIAGNSPTTVLFWEYYPATYPQDALPENEAETQPGDHMAAYIRTDGHGRWQLWVEDLNTGAVLTKTLHHVQLGSELKPEWMVEDSGSSTRPLAPFTPIRFSRLTVNGIRVNLNQGAVAESMLQGRHLYASTSSPAASGTAFAVGYRAAMPRLTGFARPRSALIDVVSPLKALPGRTVTILGAGFGRRPGRVELGSRRLPTLSWSPATIRAHIPRSAIRIGQVLQVVTARGIRAAFNVRLRRG